MNETLKKVAVPVLRMQGFKGSHPHFRRIVGDHIRVIGFQFSQWGPCFYVELGVCGLEGTTFGTVHYPPENIKFYQTHFRRRVGRLPYDFTESDASEIAGDVAFLLQNIESEWGQSMEQWRNGPLKPHESV